MLGHNLKSSNCKIDIFNVVFQINFFFVQLNSKYYSWKDSGDQVLCSQYIALV